jgi:hypothetical protein
LSDAVSISLSKPINAYDRTIDELSFRAPVAGDLRGVRMTVSDQGMTVVMGDVLDVAARLSNVPAASFNELSLADLGKVVMAVLPFSVPGLTTGG